MCFESCSNFAAANLLFKENAVPYNILISLKCRRANTEGKDREGKMSDNLHRLLLERDFPVWPERSKVVEDPEITEEVRGEGLFLALPCS